MTNKQADIVVIGAVTDIVVFGRIAGASANEYVAANVVTSVVLTSHSETPGIYEGAEKAVVTSIIQKQSTEVD